MTPADSQLPEDKNPLDYFTNNVDSWGAKEWFNRLVTAVRDHDMARRAGNANMAETYFNIASSSAFRLARDYPDALNTRAPDTALQQVAERMAEALKYCMRGDYSVNGYDCVRLSTEALAAYERIKNENN